MNNSKSQTGASGDDIIYIDLNLNSDGTNYPAALNRQVVRTAPLISDIGQYSMAVARASFPQMSIPMWQPTLLLGQFEDDDGYPSETIYFITLSYINSGGTPIDSISAPLRVIRSSMWIKPPPIDPARGLIGQPDNGFNDVYDMDTIVRMHNNAFNMAFADLQTKTVLPKGTTAPFMSYNPTTQTLQITAFPYSSYQSMTTGNNSDLLSEGIQIWYSASYYPYLPGWGMKVFNTSINHSKKHTIAKDILLITGGIPGTFSSAIGPTNPGPVPEEPAASYIMWNQEWPGFFAFRSLMRIQIIGSGLNSVMESVDLPLALINKIGTDLQSAIICDFDPDTGIAGGFQQPLIYTPQSIIPGARFIDMLPGSTLQSFSLSVQWLDSLGRSRPMYTFSNAQSASIKLVFVKKSYLKHYKE